MRKMRTAAIGMAAGAMAVMMAVPATAAQVDQNGAKQIALEHAGVAEDQVAFSNVKMDYERGKQVYDVEFFTKDYREYDYEISAADGTVVSCDYDAEASFWSSLPADQRTVSVTQDQAKEIALNHAGKSAGDVTFLKTGMEYDDGLAVYDIEFVTGDYREYDYEISAYTGEIVSYDYDAEHAGAAGQTLEAKVSAEEAKAKALATAGLDASQVTYLDARQDYDDGRLVYEGKFFYGTMEYEFEIDAGTGMVTDWDVESIYD